MSAPSSNQPGSPSAPATSDFSLFETFEVPLQAMPELPLDGSFPDLHPAPVEAPVTAFADETSADDTSADVSEVKHADPTEVSAPESEPQAESAPEAQHLPEAETVAEPASVPQETTTLEATPEPEAAIASEAAPVEAVTDQSSDNEFQTEVVDVESESPESASEAGSDEVRTTDVPTTNVAAADVQAVEPVASDLEPAAESSDKPAATRPSVDYEPPVEMTWTDSNKLESCESAQQEQHTPEVVPVDEKPSDGSSAAAAEVESPATVASDVPQNGFLPLNLRHEVQAAITSAGYEQPTEIQEQTIPHLLAGRDVLAQSQTGSGKTATFALPILSRLNTHQKPPQVLVLTPTRELATQVAESFATYGAGVPGFSVAAIYGGQGYETQLRQLKRGVPVVVGTPGRIIDHIKRGTLNLSELKTLVLDEADEMLNMGFLEDVKFVLEQTPADRQVALFSATMPPAIRGIAQHYLNDPARVTVNRGTMTAAAIRQRAVITAHRDKYDVLVRFLEIETTDGIIVFAKTREATLELAERLDRDGFPAAALNGDLPQRARERTVDQFKAGRLDVLVATDVAARGLDVSRVSHVFNFDVPQDSESYVHRIGRTGRAGRAGEAIILLSRSQKYKLRQIERLTRQAIEVVDVPSADQVNEARVARLCSRIGKTIETKDLSRFAAVIEEFAKSGGHGTEQIAAALAHLAQNGRPFFVQDLPQHSHRSERGDRRSRDYETDSGPGRGRQRDRGDDRDRGRRDRNEQGRRPQRNRPVPAGMDRYRIEVGHDDGVKPGNIVGAIANEGGIEGQYIGPINIFAGHSTIDLPEGMPSDVQQTLHQIRVAGKQLRLRPATSSDSQQDSGFRKHRHGSGGPSAGGRRFSKGKPAGKYRSKKRDR